jgi:hypothetical protein
MKDKNGTEIKVDDIVRTDDAGWIAIVKCDEEGYYCIDRKGGFSTGCNWNAFEVLGNIRDNTELMK